MKERIEELARMAMSNSVCAGEPHWITDAITTAVNEALEMAARHFQLMPEGAVYSKQHAAECVRKLKV